MAWLKSEQVETFFAYVCIVLFFSFLEIPLWIFPFVKLITKKKSSPKMKLKDYINVHNHLLKFDFLIV